MRRFLLPLALVLASCGDESEPSTPSTGPTGAVNLEVYATMEQDCPVGNVHVDIGNPKSEPPELVTEGEGGAKVACAVVPEGGQFRASGSITQGGLEFSFADVVSDGSVSATGTVTVKDPASDTRLTSSQMPCVFEFSAAEGHHIEAGRVFVQFNCGSLVSESDAAKACALRNGYVRLDRCARE